MARITVLGAGGWGTALAALAVSKRSPVTLWCRRAGLAREIARARRNEAYLPGVTLPEELVVTDNLSSAVAEANVVVWAVPSAGLRAVAHLVSGAGTLPATAVFVSAVKGIEAGTHLRMSQVLSEVFPRQAVTALSGPNHSEEVSRNVPAATVLAGAPDLAAELQQLLSTPHFRIYTSTDLPGVEVGGALKNVFALAAGMSDGLGFGDNSKAALTTRALAEMVRLGTVLGGRRDTFYGLSGAGDLMVTAFSRHSRNRRVGERLGRGERLEAIVAGMNMVAEGIPTTRAARELARARGVDAPLTEAVGAILFDNRNVMEVLQDLLERNLRAEDPA
ncbi:MAG TPA: NAD(P)H-dependent glycerol-3-phosphate dehydrogenase [Chthoniobacterales bacterium]